jgi:putative ABC transport system permease protein
MMQTLWQDLRYGARMLVKKPGFTLIAVVTLALGIGANTALFSVVDAVLLRPLPYPNAERLMTLSAAGTSPLPGMLRTTSITPADFVEWRAQQQSFSEMFAFTGAPAHLTGGREPVFVLGITTTARFFETLGVRPLLGRTFTLEEEMPGRAPVVIVSHAIWQSHLGGNPSVVGQTIRLNGKNHTVIGVLPADFKFTSPTDVVFPYELDPNQRSNAWLSVVARLKDGVTREQARTETKLIAERLQQAHPQAQIRGRLGADLTPLGELTGEKSRRALLILFAATSLVLLIACANLANLLLARASSRQRESAIRAALGAGRGRLTLQLLTESLLLALLGGVAGTLLAWWSIEALVTLAPPTLPRLRAIGIDGWALGFTLLTTVVTGVLFGLAPAWQASKTDLTQALKEGVALKPGGWRRFNLRSLLIVGEVALALVLLVGAGLLLNSLVRLLRVDPGFAPENVLTVNLGLGERDRTREKLTSFYQQSLERIRALPGVSAVGTINVLPFGEMLLRGDFIIEGQPEPPPDNPNIALKPAVNADYFRSVNIPVLKGRALTERDTADAPGVVVISESAARRFFAGRDPVGQRISFDRDRNNHNAPIWLEIVGVVGDVKQRDLRVETQPTIYMPYTQVRIPFMLGYFYYTVRSTVEPRSLAAAVQREIQALDPELPIYKVNTLSELLSASLQEQRFNALLLGLFAALALALAAIGLYGVMSYTVAQRTHEIGIRMALGAERADVLRLVIGQGMKLVLGGVAIGLATALVLTRLLKTLLFGVSATDPATFSAIAVLLTMVALVACWIPARRATQVDPMIALRYE